jgi:hypothetical protein
MNMALVLILGIPLLLLGLVLVLIVFSTSQSLLVSARKHEIWPAFAQRIGGVYLQSAHGNPDRISARIEEWPFYLDTHLIGGKQSLMECTRLRAFYPPRLPLEATICSAEWRDEIPLTSGLTQSNGTEYGLTAGIILCMNQPMQMRVLLSNPDLVRLINLQKAFELQIRRRRNWKGGGVSSAVYEVSLECNSVIIDESSLLAMYHLIEVTLHQLYKLGVAGKSFAE